MTGADLLKLAQRTRLSETTLDAIDEQVKARRRNRPRHVRL